MNMILATVVATNGIIHWLLAVLIVGICALAIWATGRWFIGKFKAPAVVQTIWDGLFILVGLFIVIAFLSGLLGHPIVEF